jgi:hypothetical protein
MNNEVGPTGNTRPTGNRGLLGERGGVGPSGPKGATSDKGDVGQEIFWRCRILVITGTIHEKCRKRKPFEKRKPKPKYVF